MSRTNQLLDRLDPTHVTRGEGDATAERTIPPEMPPMVPVRGVIGNDGIVRSYEIRYFSTIYKSEPDEAAQAGVKRLRNPVFERETNVPFNSSVTPQAAEEANEPPVAPINPVSSMRTSRRKKIAEERVRDQLAIDGTAMLKGEARRASDGGSEVYHHGGAWWEVKGDEPEEWLKTVRKASDSTDGANGEFDTISQRGRKRKKSEKAKEIEKKD